MFKMRELRGAGIVTVTHVPTEINPADIFTKILSRQVFEKHRATVLNQSVDQSAPPVAAPAKPASCPVAGSRGGSAPRGQAREASVQDGGTVRS